MDKIADALLGFVIGGVVGIAAILLAPAARSESYPSIIQLQTALGMSLGAELPRPVVVGNRVFVARVVGAHVEGNGRYSVTIQLQSSTAASINGGN